MRKLILAAGVAALAISMPAAAKPDKAGGGKGGGQAAQVQKGGGQAQRADKAAGKAVEQRAKLARQEFKQRDKGVREQAKQERKARVQLVKQDRKAREQLVKQDRKVREQLAKQDRKVREQLAKQGLKDRERIAKQLRGRDREVVRVVDRDFDDGRWDHIFGNRRVVGFGHGCPPGLVNTGAGCMPWGHYKKVAGAVLPAAFQSNILPLGLRDIYRDTDDYYYRYGDGFVYRVDRDDNLVSALLPLIGAGLGIGMPFPYQGPSYMVPSTYQPFYQPYDDDYYRYANGYVYEIDGRTGLIEDMIPLLDRGYGVGQMLPASYSYYNVPYQYRSMYYDTPDYMYRYAPGAIYQVDPTSQLITAVASLLAPGLAIGQPLPPTYSAYNVPLGYRDMYYDRPDAWYRYSNGYIYQVDPTTQLITAIVRAIV